MSFLTSKYRSHTCAELSAQHAEQSVILSGWIQRKRDHGGVVFLDLRDNYGITQIVCSEELISKVGDLKPESVVTVKGQVIKRPAELVNENLTTGTIEVKAEEIEILSNAVTLPFQVAEDDNAPEHIRLKSRFLELRREKLHKNILKRAQIISALRRLMTEQGFTEFQTPILTSSSPEGARDFIVPSRLHPGKFYALPQAPQQFKQLLMVSGFDRYFQIAPCFRDEDSRADRSPGEFYQLDLEMSFVTQEEVLAANEYVISRLFPEFSDLKMETSPFPRINYQDSLLRYGSDKPDLRNPLEISDCSEIFKNSAFRVFSSVLADKGSICGIALPVNEVPARKVMDDLVDYFSKLTGSGLAYLVLEPESYKGSIQKFVSPEEIQELRQHLAVKSTTIVFLAAGAKRKILPWLGKLRDKLGADFNLINKDSWKFCWIVNFPFYEEDPDTGKIDFAHNPFSMPQGGLDALLNTDPLEIQAYQYDLVCNGYELGSGAIRNHRPEIMYKAFEMVGYPNSVVDEKFGGMIRAFQHGAPPHGGFAHGIERIIMLLCGEEAIREIIAFPLAQNGEDLLMGAPSRIFKKQLDDVHIALNLPDDLESNDLVIR